VVFSLSFSSCSSDGGEKVLDLSHPYYCNLVVGDRVNPCSADGVASGGMIGQWAPTRRILSI